jgi:hypothetical protein
VKQSGAGLQFSVYQPTDRTGTIRMDTDNQTLQKATYGYGYGKTRAIVGGSGEGTARQFVEVASSSAESTWARRVEAFVDQRQESDSTKLTQAGTDLLNQSGGTITSMDVVPTNDTTMTYGTDFYLGDKVTVAVAAQQVTGIVSTVQVSIAEDGVRVGCTIGNPVGFDYEAVLSKRQTDTTAGVSKLQRVEAVQGTLVPAGGAANTVLTKTSATDYATGWSLVANASLANSSVTVNGNSIALGGSASVTASQITSGTLPAAQLPSGTIVQVVSTTKTDVFSTTSTTIVDVTGMSVTITPKSTSSKILVMVNFLQSTNNATTTNHFRILRGSTSIGATASTYYTSPYQNGLVGYWVAMTYLDSPASTSALTYKLSMLLSAASTGYVGAYSANTGLPSTSTITVFEVA